MCSHLPEHRKSDGGAKRPHAVCSSFHSSSHSPLSFCATNRVGGGSRRNAQMAERRRERSASDKGAVSCLAEQFDLWRVARHAHALKVLFGIGSMNVESVWRKARSVLLVSLKQAKTDRHSRLWEPRHWPAVYLLNRPDGQCRK